MGNNIFTDIWEYLYEVYLAAEPGYRYQNLGFDKNPLFSLRLAVLGFFVGLVIAVIFMAYNKISLGGIVRRIIASEANSPEKAKTLEELGFKNSYSVSHAVRKNVGLRKFVKCVEEQEFYREQNARRESYEAEATEEKRPKFKEQIYPIDTKTAHFYIPEELRIRAEIRFEKKGSGVLPTVLTVLALCVAFFVLLLVLPWLLDGINTFVGNIKK